MVGRLFGDGGEVGAREDWAGLSLWTERNYPSATLTAVLARTPGLEPLADFAETAMKTCRVE